MAEGSALYLPRQSPLAADCKLESLVSKQGSLFQLLPTRSKLFWETVHTTQRSNLCLSRDACLVLLQGVSQQSADEHLKDSDTKVSNECNLFRKSTNADDLVSSSGTDSTRYRSRCSMYVCGEVRERCTSAISIIIQA